MRNLLWALLLLAAGTFGAQHSTAPDGYYPMGYHFDAWRGVVTATNDATRQITLAYTNKKGDKTQTFTGVLEDGYKVKFKDGKEHELKVSDIPAGTTLTVYYMPKTKKENGQKVKYNLIFRIEFTRP